MLHQDPLKAERYRALAPAGALPDSDAIAVVDPGLIAAVLASSAFRVVDYAGGFRAVSGRTGIPFPAVTAALDHIPLAKEGARHKALRETMATLIGGRAREAEARLRGDAARFLAPLLKEEGGKVDLVADVALPAYDSLFSALLGFHPSDAACGPDNSQVFDRLMSLNRRKRMEASMGETLKALEGGTAGEVPAPVALALTILGRDALVGSLAVALWRAVALQPGEKLAAIAFGDAPGATGVPYVERIAVQDVALGPLSLRAGARLRLLLDATTRETAGCDAGLMFGKGRHLCLGKPLALAAWRIVTDALGASPLRAFPESLAFRGGDHVFNYPDHARVELRP